MVVTDVTVAPAEAMLTRIRAVLARARPGTALVQLRDKDRPARPRLELGKALVEACRAHGHWFVVNDRADLAVLLGADGVHLGEYGVASEEARSLLPAPGASWRRAGPAPGCFVSRACHDPARAGTMDADAVLLSPIALSRKGRPPLGLEGVRQARRTLSGASGTLLYALGGVDASNAAACVEAGADGVAVVGAVLASDDASPLLDALGIG